MSPKRGRSPISLAFVLLHTSCLFFGSTLAIPQPLPPQPQQQAPPREGEIAYMFGYQNPIRPTADNSNALVFLKTLGNGMFGQTVLVRSLVSDPRGLPGCEAACVRKSGALRTIPRGEHIIGARKADIYAAAKNELTQHNNIQQKFDRSGSRNNFFPRMLASREYEWPRSWLSDPTRTVSVVMYQEFIQGRTLDAALKAPDKQKEDMWSLGVQCMKGVFSAVQLMYGWNPPVVHNDLHSNNIMIGWIGDQAPVPSKNRLGTRAFIFDFGLSAEVDRNRGPITKNKDLEEMKFVLQRIISSTGLDPKQVTKGWLKNTLFRSPAERAVRKAYLLLKGVVPSPVHNGRGNLRPGVDVGKIYASLEKIFSGVQEKYSTAFQTWMTTPPVDRQAEPMRFPSSQELIKAGGVEKVPGPWYVTKVQRQGNQWVVQQMYTRRMYDWNEYAKPDRDA